MSLNWCQTLSCDSVCCETSLSYFLYNILFPFCTLDLLHRLIHLWIWQMFLSKSSILHSGYIFYTFMQSLEIKTMAVALLASCSIVWTTGTQRRWSKYEKGFWNIYCHTFRNDFHISIYLSFLFVVIFVSQKCLYFILVFYFNLILFRFALPLFWFALCFILLIYLCVCLFFNAIFILCFLDLFVLLCFIFLWFGSFCFTFALFIFLILGTHLKFFLSYVGLCRVMLERLGILIKLN